MALQSITALASITLTESATSVTFSGLPQNYRDLVIIWSGTLSANTGIGLIFNSDTGSNYTRSLMIGAGSSVVAATQSDNGFGEGSTTQSSNILSIIDYSAANKHKMTLAHAAANGSLVALISGRWANTAPITSITLDPASTNTFLANSTFSLYGRIA